MKKITALCALTVASLAAAVAPASANDDTHTVTGTQAGLVNVNGDVLSDLCVAPWHWDGPIQVLTDNGPYQACQSGGGGTQVDAPALDLDHDHDHDHGGYGVLPFPLAR